VSPTVVTRWAEADDDDHAPDGGGRSRCFEVQVSLPGVGGAGRGSHTFPFQLNFSSSVHPITQSNS